MRIVHGPFYGMKPGIEPNLLGLNEAQQAVNCKFERGDLRALRAPLRIQTFGLLDIATIYPWNDGTNVHWVETEEDCDYAASPRINDSYRRLFFTGMTEPRFFANDNISGTGFDPSVDYYKLGIPKPTTVPAVARVGAAGTSYRAYRYTWLNRYGDQGVGSNPGSISDYSSGRVTISGIEAAPAGRAIDRIWLYRVNSSASGSEFQFVLEAMYFRDDTSYSVGEFVVYSNQLYECTTVHPAGAWNAANFTAGEQVAVLGASIESDTYLPPPDDMTGPVLLDNGSIAGISGNMIVFSEPNQPHAYPMAYRRVCRYKPVALVVDGTDVVVVTTGKPVRYYGQHPDSMAPYHIDEWLPCDPSHKRAVSSWRGTVYWPSVNGWAAFSYGDTVAAGNASADFIDNNSWPTYKPAIGTFFNDQYIGFNSTTGIIFDFARKIVVRVDMATAHAVRISPEDGLLYMATDDPDAVTGSTPAGDMPLCLKQWEGDSANYLFANWKSRLNVLDAAAEIAYCRVLLDAEEFDAISGLIDLEALNAGIFAGDIGGAIGDDILGDYLVGGDDLYDLAGFSISLDVSIKFYGDGRLVHTEVVSAKETVFSLPAADIYTKLEVEISGYIPVTMIVMAPTPEELHNYG
jgi:hypothetical protein